MFRELTRKKKQISADDCIALLKSENRGVLSVIGDEGYPYGTVLNHYYNEDDGCLYFHCGRVGHRLEALQKCDKVSFCVCTAGEKVEGDWALKVRSVVVFGRVEIIDDWDKMVDIATRLSRKFTDDQSFIDGQIEKYGAGTLILKMRMEHICGKQVMES